MFRAENSKSFDRTASDALFRRRFLGDLGARRRAVRKTAIAFLLTSCLACTQGPNYVRPEVGVPETFRFAKHPVVPADAAVSPEWWLGFGDPELDKLIRECLDNNRDLQVATARVDEYAAIVVGTRSQAFPQIGYSAEGVRQRATERGNIPNLPNSDPYSSSFNSLLSATWEIDLWGRIKRETEAARANLFATEEARRGVAMTLIASTISGYVTLLDLDSRLRTAEATLESRKTSVAIFQLRLDGGIISDFEMAQILAEYEAAAVTVPDLRRQVAQQENALSVLVGRNPGHINRGRRLSELAMPPVPSGLPAELLTRRPDIMEAEQRLVASNALIGAARALYFPRISLTGVAGFASAALGDLFTGPARTWSFIGDIAGPIYTGGGIASANAQAEARRDQALASYQGVIQDAFRDVEDSLVQLQATREQEQSLQRSVIILRRALGLAIERYDNGYSDFLDVLDTERSLFNAELNLTAARGAEYRALVDLYLALGGGWAGTAPDASDAGGSGSGIQP